MTKPERMSRNILIVTHDYPPIVSARAIRWSALAEHWVQHGNHVDVVSAWQAGFLQKETLHGVQVHRVSAMLLENLRAWFKKARSGTKGKNTKQLGNTPRPQAKGLISRFAYWGYHKIYKQLYWPDGAFPWYRPALRQTRTILSLNEYDVLITVSPYFTAHLVGLRVHKEIPNLHWLVDIGDPFSFEEFEPHNNPHLYRKLNVRSEHKVFNTADAISVTTAETHQAYATRFSNCATKIYVIPPLLSIQEELEGYPPIFPRDDMIRLVYVGRLYADGRRPDFLLKLFTILLQTPLEDRIELHFFGDARAVEESFVAYNSLINEKIFLHGQVEHDIAARAMYDASVLINIGNKSPYQLPSKVVEYASTGKPILNIAQIECDSSMGFFKSYPVVINLIDTGGSNIENQAEDLFNFLSHLPEQLDTKYVNETLMPFQIDAIAAMYLDII